jgi:hypothetical protein
MKTRDGSSGSVYVLYVRQNSFSVEELLCSSEVKYITAATNKNNHISKNKVI